MQYNEYSILGAGHHLTAVSIYLLIHNTIKRVYIITPSLLVQPGGMPCLADYVV